MITLPIKQQFNRNPRDKPAGATAMTRKIWEIWVKLMSEMRDIRNSTF